MQPTQFNYPEFVPDQVLTSSNLNDMFDYLDEQDRLTRTNLIGVGIVCGLEVTTNNAGTQLTISAGCGVTSGGYLITFPQTTFTQRKSYNAVKQLIYEKFVDGASSTQLYNLDELFESAVVEGGIALTQSYLKDKVVLLFVELLEDNAKNCDPGSCDDKGKNIDITFRPLLISINDAAKLKTTGADYGDVNYKTLPILKMRRFNVPATLLQSTTQIFEAYSKILTTSFIANVQAALSQAYNILLPLVKDIYPDDPFAQLSASLAFLNDGSITETEAINFQYYYDLFCDIEIAYTELRETGIEALSLCCPDVNLFRRHLLLGDAIPDSNIAPLDNRQYFIPSPVMECHCKQTQKLRWLFKRIQLMLQNYLVDFAASGNFGKLFEFEQFRRRFQDTTIRITPSSLGNYPLAKKAIPFYYMPVEGDDTLLDNWDIEKTADGEADRNLSYNANQYATDDDVLNPLNYDLEPYNFLRIEGHIGMQNTTALKNIISLRDRNRLPFEVVMLSSDLESLKTALADLGKTNTVAALIEKYADQIKSPCQFQDLDSMYDTFIAEITCQLCKTMLYFYSLSEPPPQNAPDPVLSVVPLVLKCNPDYFVQPATFGYSFEQFYTQYNSGNGISYLYAMYGAFEKREGFDTNINIYYFLLLYIENFYETLTPSLGDFDYKAFLVAYKRLMGIAGDIERNLAVQADGDPSSLETLAQLKRLIALCVLKPMEALYRDYLLRWVYVMMLQKFGYFARKHPGIQHRAGVPMGGTFIMVYHEAAAAAPANNTFAVGEFASGIAQDNIKANFDVNANKADVEKRFAGTAEKKAAPAPPPSPGQAAKDQIDIPNSGQIISGPSVNPNDYRYTPPSFNSGTITNVNDLNIFKTENQKEFDDLALLLQEINDSQSSLTNVVAEIPDGTVIADFYLPYLCCSDCPPIQYTINEVVDSLTINIDPAVFCSADTQTYDIAVTPDGGNVTGEGSSKTGDGKFIFTPAAVKFAAADKQKDITLTYSAFGQSATKKITVYQKPTAAFDAAVASGGDTVTITNKSSAFADKYSWDFGNGKTSADKDPAPVTYDADGTYTIALTVLNNICSDQISHDVSIATPDVTIDMSADNFCSDNKGPNQITVSPAGTIVSGEGVVDLGGNNFSFVPNNVALSGSASKTVTLTAQKNGKRATRDVTVYQLPAANFTAVIQPGHSDTVVLTNLSSAFATAAHWDFGDGKAADVADPGTHTYTSEGSFTITLTVKNTVVCSASMSQTIGIQLPPPFIDVVPKVFCSADPVEALVNTGLNGGVVTGEGIGTNTAGDYIFKPSGVDLKGAISKTVVLSNTLGTKPPATVAVTVYQVPTAEFLPEKGTLPLEMNFLNQSQNAESYHWDFGGGNTSEATNPAFTFPSPGTYSVILTAFNGNKLCQASMPHDVTVTEQFAPKTCQSLDGINLDKFNNALNSAGNKDFKQKFLELFPAYDKEVVPFFSQIGGFGGLSVNDQTTKFGALKATAKLAGWIQALTDLLTQVKGDATFTAFIIALVEILTELLEYIICIQPKDIDKAETSVLDQVKRFCAAVVSIFGKTKAKQLLVKLIADINAEIARLNSNNENVTKAKYLAMLKGILQLLV